MKTNTRVRRDSSKKTAIPQVPNEPDSTRGRSIANGKRFDGVVKEFLAKLGFGFISIAPELAAELKLSNSQDLFFHASGLPDGVAKLLRAGAEVSFRLERLGKGQRAVAIEPRTLAAALTADGWDPFNPRVVGELAIPLMSSSHLDVREELLRDVNGLMLVVRHAKSPVSKDVTFDQACDWLVNNGQQLAPEKFLELHGIKPRCEVGTKAEQCPVFNALEFESVVNSAVALFTLLDDRNAYCGAPDLGDGDLGNSFKCGVSNLVNNTNRQLLAVRENYFKSREAGAL